jgi:hypothetical protein
MMRVLLTGWIALAVSWASAAGLLVEAESFHEHGGWALDAQFSDLMGSPYLLAHGLGQPVANAKTEVEFPEAGAYHVWVRTKDWVPSHHPGRFRVLLDGEPIGGESDRVFGAAGDGWIWQDASEVRITSTRAVIELEDLSGFDGRCDAVYFSTDAASPPPGQPGPIMAAWRKRLLGLPDTPPPTERVDLVVVGGGVAGCCAAVTAARLDLKVALVQDRPVLGGNASSEIGITPAGLNRTVVAEIAMPNRAEIVRAEKNVHLYLGWHAFAVQKQGGRITSVDIKNTRTSEELRLAAPLFVDCTGDGWIGFWAGADYRMGREGRDEFDESMAPEKPDKMTHGATLYFKTRFAEQSSPFPEVPWATEVSGDHCDPISDHSWEHGHWRDMIGEAEEIRDHMFQAIYGNFATIKKRFPQQTDKLQLAGVTYVAARGESRRLMGDHILTENDIKEQRPFPDGVATGGLVFCLHYPREKYDFRSDLKLTRVEPYLIPFRCLYSRNVDNLMMAGRDASASHIAYSSIKLMKTGGQMGVATGAAAFLCKKYDASPRGVYRDHLEELKNVVFERGDCKDALAPPTDP